MNSSDCLCFHGGVERRLHQEDTIRLGEIDSHSSSTVKKQQQQDGEPS